MQGMPGAAMPMDSAMLRRHMLEEDTMMARMRADVVQMRRLSPDQWPAHMPAHLAVMDAMFAMMQRHMSEEGAAMQQHHMGRGMGMHREMHQRMMGEMQALHSDAEFLRHASPAEMRQRMPAHLDRLDRMLQMMQQMHTQMPGMR
jgi:hemerythrin